MVDCVIGNILLHVHSIQIRRTSVRQMIAPVVRQ
jgi:hypothetical protein